MKNIAIIGCTVFIVIIILGLIFYKTSESFPRNPYEFNLSAGPNSSSSEIEPLEPLEPPEPPEDDEFGTENDFGGNVELGNDDFLGGNWGSDTIGQTLRNKEIAEVL